MPMTRHNSCGRRRQRPACGW